MESHIHTYIQIFTCHADVDAKAHAIAERALPLPFVLLSVVGSINE